MRYAAGMARRAAARKARDGEVEAAPEKMYRACLAEETGAELLEHAVGAGKDLQKALYGARIIGCVQLVVRKSDRVRQLVRHVIDDDVDVELGKCRHHGGVETRDRMTGKRQPPRGAATG